MTLFVDTSINNEALVQVDLIKIALNDGGLGNLNPANNFIQMTYSQSVTGFGPNQLNTVINTLQNSIFVFGVESSFVFPDSTPITNVFGTTSFPDSANNINIVYDVKNGFGTGYFVFDINGNQICFPTFVGLGHELSHALHLSDGTFDSSNPEVQAENDENAIRQEHNIVLRDAHNHGGGVGTVACQPFVPNTDPDNGNGCFIVSAAYGSPSAVQVSMLQQMRDYYSRESILVGWFMSQMRDQYYRFSPQISMDMWKCHKLRSCISQLIVEPLICYFQLLDLYFNKDEDALLNAANSALSGQIATLHENSLDIEKAKQIYSKIIELKANFARRHAKTAHSPNPPASMDVLEVLSYVFDSIEASSPPNNWLEWAMMEPLAIYWSAIARLEDSSSDDARIGEYLIDSIKIWLKQMPIPPIVTRLNEEELINELDNRFFSDPLVRERLVHRILSEYGNLVQYDLKSVLQNEDHLTSSGTDEEVFND